MVVKHKHWIDGYIWYLCLYELYVLLLVAFILLVDITSIDPECLVGQNDYADI